MRVALVFLGFLFLSACAENQQTHFELMHGHWQGEWTFDSPELAHEIWKAEFEFDASGKLFITSNSDLLESLSLVNLSWTIQNNTLALENPNTEFKMHYQIQSISQEQIRLVFWDDIHLELRKME